MTVHRNRAPGGGIVDFTSEHWPAKNIGTETLVAVGDECSAEITGAIGGRGNRDGHVVDDLRFAELLEIEKEKCLVLAVIKLGNLHRATNGKPIVVASGTRANELIVSSAIGQTRVGERRSGVEDFVDEIIVDRAVKLVGAGLDIDVEQSAADRAIFRREIAGLDGDFLDCIYAWLSLRRRVGKSGVRGILPFHMEGIRIRLRSIDLDLRVRNVICARNHVQHIIRIANTGTARIRGADTKHRQLIERLHFHVRADVAGLGLQQAGFSANRNGL